LETDLFVPPQAAEQTDPPTNEDNTSRSRAPLLWAGGAVFVLLALTAAFLAGTLVQTPVVTQTPNAVTQAPPPAAPPGQAAPAPTPAVVQTKVERPRLMSQAEKTSRDNILKDLLKISSATA